MRSGDRRAGRCRTADFMAAGFIIHFTLYIIPRLALSFHNIGGGSEEEKQNFQLCFSFFSRLTLTLRLQK